MFILEPIIELIIEHAVKKVYHQRHELLDKISQNSPEFLRWRNFFVPQAQLINRERELRTIQTAIDETPNSRIIFLIGPGGVGKTRILQEIEKTVKSKRAKPPVRWSGILDMYHPDLRTVLGLQSLLIENLDPKEQSFTGYRTYRANFEDRRKKGTNPQTLEQEHERLNELFLEDFNQFAQQYRPVLVFDTVENLSPESDLIQKLCKIDNPQVAVRDWLLKETTGLANTVILLAGRPQETIRTELQHIFNGQPGRLEVLNLEGLTREDCRQLLRFFVRNASPTAQGLVEQANEIWQQTKGLPVQLALVTELASRFDTAIQQDTSGGADPQVWGNQIATALFKYDDDDPIACLFFILALARRGLTPELLHHLEPTWPLEKCQEHLDSIKQLSVVKLRNPTGEIFLHDALYELFDVLQHDQQLLEPWYQRLTDYYRGRQARAGADRATWGQATVGLLYYELQRDPKNAFEECYLRWDDIVIRGREAELEVQLRDEFLRFFSSPINLQRATSLGLTTTSLEQESAIRWVKYFVDKSNYLRSATLAETVIGLIPSVCDVLPNNGHATLTLPELPPDQQNQAQTIFQNPSAFFCGQLLTYYGDALAFTGENEERVSTILQRAIDLLKTVTFQADEPLAWLHKRVLGRAYNALGYLAHSYGHYGKAMGYFRVALTHYSIPEVDDERGNTLNNLAYLLAILGDLKAAKKYANDALSLRQRLGQEYPIGLSYNTRGRIYALGGDVEWGQKECTWALSKFETIDSPRGIGLAYNALGYIHRLKGEIRQNQPGRHQRAQVLTEFKQAAVYLQKATEIFTQLLEPIRLWEAYNELGSLYCDWGALSASYDDVADATTQRERSIQYHRQALAVATEHHLHFQAADTYEDLAQVCADQGENEQADVYLQQSQSVLPATYADDLERLQPSVDGSGEFYWLILGKAHFRRGIWLFRTADPSAAVFETALEHWGLAVGYFQRFWPGSHYLYPRLQFMRQQIRLTGLHLDFVKAQLIRVAVEHQLNLDILLRVLDEAKPIA